MLAKNHFDDCPYNCNDNGLILDDILGKYVPCPHCSKKKKELVRQGYIETEEDVTAPIQTVLGIKSDFLSSKFVYDAVIPDGERLFIDEESLEWQSKLAEELYLGLTVGTLPEESMCFGISIKGKFDKFVFPMLVKAYTAGLTICRFISCAEYYREAFDVKNSLKEYHDADILFMLINEGSTAGEISSAKGLMQIRSLKGKPTIFVTTWTIEACSALLGFNDDSSLMLAKPVFVKYKQSKNKKQSSYINNLLGVENEAVESSSSVTMTDLFNME